MFLKAKKFNLFHIFYLNSRPYFKRYKQLLYKINLRIFYFKKYLKSIFHNIVHHQTMVK